MISALWSLNVVIARKEVLLQRVYTGKAHVIESCMQGIILVPASS